MPFDDDKKPKVKKTLGVKHSNATSEVNQKVVATQAFEAGANAQFSKIEEYKQRAWDLSVKYKSFVENKVLADNKGVISSNLEKEVIEKLIQLASEMNEDPTQDQAVGSTAICMILLKCMLVQRDIINELSFKMEKLEKKIPTISPDVK